MNPLHQFVDEPDFVNDEGVKWWMVSRNIWAVELPTGEREYVGIHRGEIVANSTALDAVAIKLELITHADKPLPDVPQWADGQDTSAQA